MHENPFIEVYRLLRHAEVNGFVRVMSAVNAFALLQFGRGAALSGEDAAYQQAIFGAVQRFADYWMWGGWFFVAALLLMLAAITARAWLFCLGVAAATLVLGLWITLIVMEARANPEALLTDGALGYFVLAGGSIWGTAFAPRQLATERPIVAVTESGDVTHLRRAG